ncbi:cysteine desulfurase [Clostridium sp. AM48-13]|jgi:cysteine desulfurase|uniref:cysteine desulfurase family protein n=1 Tax=Clostridium TaxID=1485 RepID=UPI000E47AC6D|nr:MULTISPECIES: cysteine desulfurase family protein [Clostridium]RHQ19694.1 cysteine desulfurase [Clostridium sp. AM48-13]RHQ34005.1 cysteine desulfurase [Clostridium sp. AF27-5AA]
MEAYFDNSATTKVLDCVKDAVVDAMCVNYGNAAAKHRKGVEAENLVREAKKAIADTLKVQEKEILFTSGGTESNNTALIGTALANRRAGKHLITTGVEHPSIYNTMSFLEEMGFEVTYLPVDHLGHISLEDLEKAIREDTILVSVMYVNNEVGAVEPIEAISQCIKKKNPKTLFHVDAIQAYGKYKIRPKKQGIDLLSVSGHKIHAPKGVGFLYIRDGVKIRPILFGGGQQKGMRSGTENVPGCVGLGVAAREAYKDFDARIEKLYTLREHLIAGLKPLGGVTINGSEDRTNAPQIVSASFGGVRSEVLLHALEDKGVYVSSGSACSSNHPGISGTLKGIGVKKELLDSTIRFSLGDLNTEEEVDYAIGVLGELLPVLRRYQMK